MVKTKDEIMEELRVYIGDRSDDETISLIENISDTLDEVGKSEYDEKIKAIEDEWRRRYIDRFMNGGENKNDIPEDEPEEKTEDITIDDLYIDKEENNA